MGDLKRMLHPLDILRSMYSLERETIKTIFQSDDRWWAVTLNNHRK